jgi:Putative zinc-finger
LPPPGALTTLGEPRTVMADDGPHLDPDTLLRYAHGEMSSQEAKDIERHLADCKTCRKTLSKALAPPPGAVDSYAGLQHGSPPTMDLPETQEHREIPSQVSVMNIPQTVEQDHQPSHTSVVTGIGPTPEPASRPRRKVRQKRRRSRVAWVIAFLVLLLLAAATTTVLGVRPKARSAVLTASAAETLRPVTDQARLAQLQHPALHGSTAYRPGDDPALELRLTEAEDELSRAVEANPANIQARQLLALTHLLHGDPRVARQQVLEVEALSGTIPEVHLGLGILDFLAAGVAEDPSDRAYSLEQADAHFAAITLGDPGYPESIYNRSVVASTAGDADEARRLLMVYVELRPGSSWIQEQQRRIDPGDEE